MKKLFSWYHRPTSDEFKKLWEEGTFVFDTNVLLTLYRYPDELRNLFISVIEKISDRVWIPYHVGLEFHRNRFTRINDENDKVNSLIADVEKCGATIVDNVTKLTKDNVNAGLKLADIQAEINSFKSAHKAICDAIAVAKNNLPESSLEDPIGTRVLELFNEKVGAPPASQESLNEMLSKADARLDNDIPPGFEDSKKKGTFFDGEIQYHRKHGDLIIWLQTIDYVKTNNKKSIIFITDDSKPDWWEFEGHLTRGPHPALLQEMRTKGEAELFWIYKSNQFLQFAKEYLQAREVTEQAVEQVKDISENSAADAREDAGILTSHYIPSQPHLPKDSVGFVTNHLNHRWANNPARMAERKWEAFEAERMVEQWLRDRYPGGVYQNKGFPDFIAQTGIGNVGFEVKLVRSLDRLPIHPRIEETFLRGYREIMEGNISAFVLVLFLADGNYLSDAIVQRLHKLMEKYRISSTVIGSQRGYEFAPEIVLGQPM